MWQVDEAGTAVVIAAVGDKEGSTYQDFLASLPDSDCRYGGAQGAAASAGTGRDTDARGKQHGVWQPGE